MRLRTILILAGLALPAAYLGYGLAYIGYSAWFAGPAAVSADFETGDLSQWSGWGAHQLCCDHSARLVASPVRAGEHAAGFTIRRDDPLVKGSLRAELRGASARFGRDLGYAFSLYVPDDWAASPILTTAVQWHAVPDKLLGEKGRPPPLSLNVTDETFWVQVNWDRARITRGWFGESGSAGSAQVWSGPLERGRWIDWLFKVRWSPDDDGVIEVWRDGERLARREGPNAYNDFLAPYLKLGVYNWGWLDPAAAPVTDERTFYFDEIKVE